MVDLKEIQQIETSDSKTYFPDHEPDIMYLAVALAGEVGEVCNEIKKSERGDLDFWQLQDKLEGELPDVLIYLVMVASAMAIDLEKAYALKKEYNDERFGRETTKTV